jgi:hypothetical protein
MNTISEYSHYLSRCLASEYFYIQEKYPKLCIIGCEVVVDGDIVSAFIRFSLRDKNEASQLSWMDFNHDFYLTSKEALGLPDSMLSFGRDFLNFNETNASKYDAKETRNRNIQVYLDGLVLAKQLTKSDAVFYFCEDGEDELKVFSLPIVNGSSVLVDTYMKCFHQSNGND